MVFGLKTLWRKLKLGFYFGPVSSLKLGEARLVQPFLIMLICCIRTHQKCLIRVKPLTCHLWSCHTDKDAKYVCNFFKIETYLIIKTCNERIKIKVRLVCMWLKKRIWNAPLPIVHFRDGPQLHQLVTSHLLWSRSGCQTLVSDHGVKITAVGCQSGFIWHRTKHLRKKSWGWTSLNAKHRTFRHLCDLSQWGKYWTCTLGLVLFFLLLFFSLAANHKCD